MNNIKKKNENIFYLHSNLNRFPSSTVLSCNGTIIVGLGLMISSSLIFLDNGIFSPFKGVSCKIFYNETKNA